MIEGPSVPLLTLEPLIEAVRQGVEDSGWILSGLQKTTSHEFAGRWEGESTRSAYLFFHRSGLEPSISLEAYLDETTRGLQGNLSLVIDGRPLGQVGDAAEALRRLATVVVEEIGPGHALSVSLRARLGDPEEDPGEAQVEFRFRLRVPGAAIRRGVTAVIAMAAQAVGSFEALASHAEVERVAARG
jgi:hypothetical protein